MVSKKTPITSPIERLAFRVTMWIGSPTSIVLHTIFFIIIFVIYYLGVSLDEVLLILTTVVSIEAIYQNLFIQLTVNRHAESLEEVGEDIDEIQDDIEEISEDIEQIQEEEEDEDQKQEKNIDQIETDLRRLLHDIDLLRQGRENQKIAEAKATAAGTNQ